MAVRKLEGLGLNVEGEISGDILTLRIDLSKTNGQSKSAKSDSIATTGGNQTLIHNSQILKVGVNVFKPLGK